VDIEKKSITNQQHWCEPRPQIVQWGFLGGAYFYASNCNIFKKKFLPTVLKNLGAIPIMAPNFVEEMCAPLHTSTTWDDSCSRLAR